MMGDTKCPSRGRKYPRSSASRTRLAITARSEAVVIWTIVVLAVLVLVLFGFWVSWRASRLDRLHNRVESARTALDLALVRRSSAAADLASDLEKVLGTQPRIITDPAAAGAEVIEVGAQTGGPARLRSPIRARRLGAPATRLRRRRMRLEEAGRRADRRRSLGLVRPGAGEPGVRYDAAALTAATYSAKVG